MPRHGIPALFWYCSHRIVDEKGVRGYSQSESIASKLKEVGILNEGRGVGPEDREGVALELPGQEPPD
jgi:hypothetical protein